MKHNKMMKHILPVLLAALVAFSSLGLGSLAPLVQAEEASSASVNTNPDGSPATDWSQKPKDSWDAKDNNGRYKYIDIAWFAEHTSDAIYTLNNEEQLAGLMVLSKVGAVTDKNGKAVSGSGGRNFSGKTIRLSSNMDIGAHCWTGISCFNGIFDGSSFVVSNVWLDNLSVNMGFFSEANGTIKNVIIDQSHYRLNQYSAALVGYSNGSVQISNCKVSNTEIMISGSGQARVGGIAGQINTGNSNINNCSTENLWIKNDGTTNDLRHVAMIVSVFSAASIKNCTVSGGGILLDDTNKGHNYDTLNVASIYAAIDNSGAQVTGCSSDAMIQVRGFTRSSSPDANKNSINIGGLYAGIGSDVTYSCFTGSVEAVNCQAKNILSIGGLAGSIAAGKSVANCYNAGKITVEDCTVSGSADLSKKAAGVVGNLEGSMDGCYNSGTITGMGSNSTNAFGGLTGTIGGTISNCFYINAVKASGDDNSTGTNAINLAAIKDSSGTDIVTQIRQGDDTARVVLADAEQLKGLQNASALGESFGIQVPTASAFVSDKPSAVQAIVNTDNSVGLKTSGGTGGAAAITAKLYLNQNELAYAPGAATRTFCGPVKSVEAPITLNLNVVYVGLNNKSPTSAIEDTTDFGLRAGVTFGGTGVDKDSYTLKWFKSSNKQSSPPDSSAAGAEVAGLTETWDDVTAGEVTWKKTADTKAQFTADDAGWYKLRATPTNSAGAFKDYTFETAWQYLSVDNLMVFDDSSTMPDKIELSRQDTDIENKTRLAVKIEIADGFTGSIKYGWYKVDETTTPIAGTEKTAAITTDAAAHTITDTLTVGNAYSDALKGTYQLIVTSVTPDGQTAQTKDIRGPASEIRCYNAEIKDDYVQAGPGYEGTPGNTMTQSIITLSEDFAASMYDAYWIKGGTLDESTDLSDYTQVRHATLTQQADGTYKAIAAFNMEKGCEGDNYQLVIYPTNTTRPWTDTAMQFKGAANCVLTLYSIDTVTYNLADRYSTTEMTAEGVLIPSPAVDTINPDGSLTYTKVSGPETFTIDSAGRIICPTDLSAISNGLYTYTIKVTEEGFKNDAGAVLSGPGMSKNVTISFQVTGSSDFPLTDKNLYIYDTGYILADSEPDQATSQIIPYQGIYNIPAGTGESNVWQHTITVVSGEHTGSGRIILGGSFSTTGAPITVKTGASAQVSIADGTGITLTNTSSGGPSLKSDGSLILAGGAGTSTLNAPGGIAGGGSLTIGAADHKGMTVDAASAITTANTTIESGHVEVSGNIGGNVTVKGGNVKADTIGTSGAIITIDGGSIIGTVSGDAKDSAGEPVYPVTLRVSAAPEAYKDQALTVMQCKQSGADTRHWEATASGDRFKKDGGSNGELYVYLPYDTADYTTVTAVTDTGSFTRNIRADKNKQLATSLLSMTYSVKIPKSVGQSNVSLGNGAAADITIGMNNNDGWLYEGRTIDLEISPNEAYRDVWGNYLLKKEGANADAYKPEFWIQTPSGSALSKAGYFGTLTEQSRTSGQTGQLIVPADSRITEGTYKSQLNWKIIPNDPVVGGEK